MNKGMLIIFFFLFLQLSLWAQPQKRIVHLTSVYNKAATDAEKIAALDSLAEYYYIYRLEKEGDSVLQLQLSLAQLSNDKNLVLAALFSNAISTVTNWTRTETFDRTISFIQKGLQYAKESGNDDYIALAHIRMASVLRKAGQPDNALQSAFQAFTAISNNTKDSVKAVLYIEMGEIYQSKNDPVAAYKNYNHAFDISYKLKNVPLQSEIYHRYSALYQSLGDSVLAQNNLLKSLELNAAYKHAEGRLKDYIDLARLTDKKEFIDKALLLADSLKSERYKLFAKRLLYAYYMVKRKDANTALNYFYNNEDLKQWYVNRGMANYYWNLGAVYYYAHRPDSAIFYYKLAEPELEKEFGKTTRILVYRDIAECYVMLNQPQPAIEYYEKTLALSSDISSNAAISDSLSKLYGRIGEYKKAYDYTQLYLLNIAQLNEQTAKREVALLEVDRENKKHEKDMEELAEKKLRKTNLQYMAISIAIVFLFLFMIVVGMFPVSRVTIKMLGYFTFICLFEFLVLLIDSFLHRLTHGEPLKIWLIKIVLIALLVPFQHFLEHGLIKFIASRKLVEARSKLSVKKWWRNKKRASEEEVDFEEDTAVL